MRELRDNRDPELMGFAVLGVPRRPGQRLSEALDEHGELPVPNFGSDEAAALRGGLNGHLARASEQLCGRIRR